MDTNIDECANQLMDALGEYLGTKDEAPKAALYHYTDFKGLKGILESRRLWLTAHRYLNDPSEIEYGKKIILDVIKDRLGRNPQLNMFFQSAFESLITEAYQCYITSFCKEGDYLPAWRYYGNDGAGFSIGFREKYFHREAEGVCPSEALVLFKVQYNAKTYRSHPKSMFNIASKIYPNWISSDFNKKILRYLEALTANLIVTLPRTKHEDYKDEKEWRMCMLRIFNESKNSWSPAPLPNRLVISKVNTDDTPPFCKTVHNRILRIESEQFDYSDIEKIIIGPRLDFLTAKLAIEKILHERDLTDNEINNMVIERSKRPYQ